MPRPNWFFAFPLPGPFVLDLPPLPRFLRRFHPDDVHLTLSFLGGCGEEAALRGLAALAEQLRATPVLPIGISLGEVVPMGGSRKSYSALSALLDEGRAEATACVTSLRDIVSTAALGKCETRPAKPHVSIARPRSRATEADREAGLCWAAALDLRAVRANLDRVALYTWAEMRNERLFRVVAEQMLEPGAN